MSRNSALVLALALGGLILPAQAFAQLTPPAGSAGAGNSAISGVPFGPANPRVLSDPSGIGNVSRIPPLGTNPPAPQVSYGSVNSLPPSRTRVVAGEVAHRSARSRGFAVPMRCMWTCQLMARFGPRGSGRQYPFIGVKRTWQASCDRIDLPERTDDRMDQVSSVSGFDFS